MRLVSLALCCGLAACAGMPEQTPAPPAPASFDAALAARLGADEHGMRRYVLVILKTGPATAIPAEERARLFQGHMSNIQRLSDEGRLAVAGPFAAANERQYRGVFIFNVEMVEEAAQLVATDPAVAAGIFDYEAYPWYGTAALMEVPGIHQRLER